MQERDNSSKKDIVSIDKDSKNPPISNEQKEMGKTINLIG